MEHLCLDIGNTYVKAGVFRSGELIQIEKYDSVNFVISSLLVKSYKAIAISNIGHKLDTHKFLAHCDLFIDLSAGTPLPIAIDYKTPETLGRDRIAAAIGVWKKYHTAAAIIDIGTCITLDYIDSKGVYRGGNISPGRDMRFRAMHENTQNLPWPQDRELTHDLGKSTSEAILNGVIFGLQDEIQGFISRLSENIGKEVLTLFTGGGAEFFAKRMKKKIFVSPYLILEGLNEIIQYNLGTLRPNIGAGQSIL